MNNRYGKNNNFYGKKHSEESKKKMSLAQKRRMTSEITRENLRAKHLGKKLSIETKKKMGLAHKGFRHSEESRKKMSRAQKGHSVSKEAKIKMSTSHTGVKLSEEHARHLRGKTPWNKGKKTGPLSDEHKRKIKEWSMANPRRGENSGYWKGGITKLSGRIRELLQYKAWRLSVYERDHFTCMMPNCTKIEKKLNSHHIKNLSKIIEENKITTIEQALLCEELWNINNGITLCKKCHEGIRQHEKNYIPIFTEIIKLFV